jgi:hypothetical protein
MKSTKMQKFALATREAHLALLDLKALVDSATEKIHAAELEAVGLAVGHRPDAGALRILRAAADALRSPNFDVAVSQAREKMETAAAWQQDAQVY